MTKKMITLPPEDVALLTGWLGEQLPLSMIHEKFVQRGTRYSLDILRRTIRHRSIPHRTRGKLSDWTSKEIELLHEYRGKRGLTYDDVALALKDHGFKRAKEQVRQRCVYLKIGDARLPNGKPRVTWTDDERAKLRQLRASGATQVSVAKQLSKSLDQIKVESKRLGIMISLPRGRQRQLSAPLPQPTVVNDEPTVAPSRPQLETMITRHPSCQFPFGDPKDPNFHFCARPVGLGQVYCPEHYKICH